MTRFTRELEAWSPPQLLPAVYFWPDYFPTSLNCLPPFSKARILRGSLGVINKTCSACESLINVNYCVLAPSMLWFIKFCGKVQGKTWCPQRCICLMSWSVGGPSCRQPHCSSAVLPVRFLQCRCSLLGPAWTCSSQLGGTDGTNSHWDFASSKPCGIFQVDLALGFVKRGRVGDGV